MSKVIPIERSTTYDLVAIAAELRTETAYQRSGHTARTLVREADLRLVLIAMQAGSLMPEHQTDETIAVQILTGLVRLTLPEQTLELAAGQLIALERGLKHEVQALEASSLVLTLGWHDKSSVRAP